VAQDTTNSKKTTLRIKNVVFMTRAI